MVNKILKKIKQYFCFHNNRELFKVSQTDRLVIYDIKCTTCKKYIRRFDMDISQGIIMKTKIINKDNK